MAEEIKPEIIQDTPLSNPTLVFPKLGSTAQVVNIFTDAQDSRRSVPSQAEFSQKSAFWIKNRYISPNALQFGRFGDEKTYIQGSPAITQLLNQETINEIISKQKVCVTGRAGMGKSYALLMFVLGFRKEDVGAILYINNPAALLENWVKYVAKEVIYAIAGQFEEPKLRIMSRQVFKIPEDEKNPLRSIQKIFSEIIDISKDQALIDIIKNLQKYYQDQEQSFGLVLDQCTKLEDLYSKNAAAKAIGKHLLPLFPMKIFGTSNLEPLSSIFAYPEILIGSKFSEDEGYEFLKHRLPPESLLLKDIIIEKEAAMDGHSDTLTQIRHNTEFIPYELQVLASIVKEQPHWNLEKILSRYYLRRIPEVQEVHKNWIDRLRDAEKGVLNQFIFLLDNFLAQGKESLTSLITKPDPNFVEFDETDCQWRYISRLAKEAIFQFHRQRPEYIKFVEGNLAKYAKKIVEMILTSDLPPRTKGDLFERFIQYTIRIAANRQEIYEIQYYSKDQKFNTVRFRFKSSNIDNFDHNNLKTKIRNIIHQKETGVLFPMDPDYQYVDLIIVNAENPEKKMIYLCQVTINIKTHSKSDVFYNHEMNKPSAATSHISNIISDLIEDEKESVETQFLWIGGDDLDPGNKVDPANLLGGKHSKSWITLTRLNKQIYQFLNF